MKTIQQIISDQIALEQSYIAEHEAIKAILLPLEGKPINKVSLSSKRMGTFKLEYAYSTFHIVGKFNHLIGHNSNPFISVEAFEQHDICHGKAALARIEKLKSINIAALEAVQSKLSHHFFGLCEVFKQMEDNKLDSYNNPTYYDILRSVYDGDGRSSIGRIQLSDFYYIRHLKQE